MAQVITLRNIYNVSGQKLTQAYDVVTNSNSDSIVSQGTGIFSYKTGYSMENFPLNITLKGLVTIGEFAYGVAGNRLYRFSTSTSTNNTFTYQADWDMTAPAYTATFPFVNGTNVIQNAAAGTNFTFSEPLQINTGGSLIEVNTNTLPNSYTVTEVFGTTNSLATDGTNIYVLLPDNRIAKITMEPDTLGLKPLSISIITSLPVPVTYQSDQPTFGLAYQDGYLYTFGQSAQLTWIDALGTTGATGSTGFVYLTGGTTGIISSALGGSVSAYTYGTYNFLFIAKSFGGDYYQMDVLQMDTPKTYSYSTENRFAFQEVPINTTISGNTLYTVSSKTFNSVTNYNVYQLQIGVADIPICFLKGTYIYTNEGYKLIETLKKGDFVNTFKDNYVRIDTIVEEELIHDAEKERNNRQLFKLSYPEYPQLLKDLYITGAHSILVGKLTEKQEKQIIKDYGRTFATDLFDRLPAYIDEKAKVHEESGTYTIYHLCLENENMYSNYGIFANGLLVESISKNDCVNRNY